MAARILTLERGTAPVPNAGDSSRGMVERSSHVQNDGVGVQQGYSAARSILGETEVPHNPRHEQSSSGGLHAKSPNAFAGRSSHPPGFGGYSPPCDDGVGVLMKHHNHHPGPQAQAFVYDACRRNGLHRRGLNWSGYTIHGDYRRQQPAAVLDAFLSGGQRGHDGLNVEFGRWHGRRGTTPRAPSFDGSGLKPRLFKNLKGERKRVRLFDSTMESCCSRSCTLQIFLEDGAPPTQYLWIRCTIYNNMR